VCWHDIVALMHESTVHEMPSLQLTGVPGWQPSVALHVDVPPQYVLGHAESTGVCAQACVLALQLSVVQPIMSSQLGGAAATQPIVMLHDCGAQNVPPHAASFGTNVQPPALSEQESAVHEMPSLHVGGVPAWQPSVALHVSTPSQTRWSSHTALFGVCWQPPVGSHESTVQGMPSSQLSGVPGRQMLPAPHVSIPLQTLLSLHVALVVQAMPVSQPFAGSPGSAVQI
jgi:hypothetical protein